MRLFDFFLLINNSSFNTRNSRFNWT